MIYRKDLATQFKILPQDTIETRNFSNKLNLVEKEIQTPVFARLAILISYQNWTLFCLDPIGKIHFRENFLFFSAHMCSIQYPNLF